jgi:hypothetical protein
MRADWYDLRMRRAFLTHFLLSAACAGTLLGCEARRYDPAKATRAYPFGTPQERIADVQVFNDGDAMLIVNPTVESWSDFDLWLNQRYMKRIARLEAGGTLRIPLEEFWDVRGEGPFPGGLLRYYPPTPIRLVQVDRGDGSPLVGLISIPTERELESTRIDNEQM